MLLVLPCSYNVTGQKYNKAYYQAHVSPILPSVIAIKQTATYCDTQHQKHIMPSLDLTVWTLKKITLS